jgi:hypothetical protein
MPTNDTERRAASGPPAGPPPMLPDFEVVHNIVGTHARGEIIPHGTYDEEQLARLVGLGAIKPVAPPMAAPGTRALLEAFPDSPEAFKAREEERARLAAGEVMPAGTHTVEAGGGGVLDGLPVEQADGLRRAGYDSPEAIRAASDEQLDAVPGVGPATIRTLRERVG